MEYPIKPVAVPAENVLWKSLLSMAGFAIAYYVIFDQNAIHAISLIMVLLIHEAGHFLTMKHYGYQNVKMFFMPLMGAYVVGEKEMITQKQKVMVILAGPIPGILIGFILKFFVISLGYNEFNYIANTFIFLNAFNLLPILPFDGGRLLEALFVSSKEIVQSIFLIISMVLIVTLAFYINSLFLLPILVLLFLNLRMLWKSKNIRKELTNSNVNYISSYSELSDENYYRIKEVILKKIPELNKSSVSEQSIMNVVKNVLQEPPTLTLSVGSKTLIVIIWILFFLILPVIALVLQFMLK